MYSTSLTNELKNALEEIVMYFEQLYRVKMFITIYNDASAGLWRCFGAD